VLGKTKTNKVKQLPNRLSVAHCARCTAAKTKAPALRQRGTADTWPAMRADYNN